MGATVLCLLACVLALVNGQDSVSDIISAVTTVGIPAAESLLDSSGSITAELAVKCQEIEQQTGIDLCTPNPCSSPTLLKMFNSCAS